MRAMFEQIANAKASMTGNYIKPGGKYLWEIQNILPHDGFNGSFYIAECLCRESVPTGEVGRDGKVLVPNAVGASASLCVNLSDPKQQSAAGNVKTFVMGLFGVAEGEISAQIIAETCSEVEKDGTVTKVTPCRGMLVRDETWQKPQKKDPTKDFTYHRWTNVEQTADEVKARAAELDKMCPLNVKK